MPGASYSTSSCSLLHAHVHDESQGSLSPCKGWISPMQLTIFTEPACPLLHQREDAQAPTLLLQVKFCTPHDPSCSLAPSPPTFMPVSTKTSPLRHLLTYSFPMQPYVTLPCSKGSLLVLASKKAHGKRVGVGFREWKEKVKGAIFGSGKGK